MYARVLSFNIDEKQTNIYFSMVISHFGVLTLTFKLIGDNGSKVSLKSMVSVHFFIISSSEP